MALFQDVLDECDAENYSLVIEDVVLDFWYKNIKTLDYHLPSDHSMGFICFLFVINFDSSDI